MISVLLVLSLCCLLAGLLAFFLARAARRRAGLPTGPVRYSDTGLDDRAPQTLFSPRYRLAGRPDYLVERAGSLIPVEVKSGNAPASPYRSHALQVGAYCLLVEETQGRPPYGLIRYADRTMPVSYTDELRGQVIEAMREMREALGEGTPPAQTGSPARCRQCGYRDDCADLE